MRNAWAQLTKPVAGKEEFLCLGLCVTPEGLRMDTGSSG